MMGGGSDFYEYDRYMSEHPELLEKQQLICPYRPWNVLLEEPADMTDEEKARLKRIKQIPKVAFDSCLIYADTLRDKIMELEAEHDKIMDFLNGEEPK